MTEQSASVNGGPSFCLVDGDGDEFPSASIFFLDNTKGRGRLVVNAQSKWIVQCSTSNPTIIALKAIPGGQYLAPSKENGSQVCLSDLKHWWSTYQTKDTHNFMLALLESTGQGPHMFLAGGQKPYLIDALQHNVNSTLENHSWSFANTPEYNSWKQMFDPSRAAPSAINDGRAASQSTSCSVCEKRDDITHATMQDRKERIRLREHELEKKEAELSALEERLKQWQRDLDSRNEKVALSASSRPSETGLSNNLNPLGEVEGICTTAGLESRFAVPATSTNANGEPDAHEQHDTSLDKSTRATIEPRSAVASSPSQHTQARLSQQRNGGMHAVHDAEQGDESVFDRKSSDDEGRQLRMKLQQANDEIADLREKLDAALARQRQMQQPWPLLRALEESGHDGGVVFGIERAALPPTRPPPIKPPPTKRPFEGVAFNQQLLERFEAGKVVMKSS